MPVSVGRARARTIPLAMTGANRNWCLCVSGSLMFTVEPRATVYVPPAGFPGKYVVCATNEPASIVWRYEVEPKAVLDESTYNITSLSPSSSRIFLTHDLLRFVPGRLITDQLHCEVGNVTSGSFRFRQGGIYCKNYQVL